MLGFLFGNNRPQNPAAPSRPNRFVRPQLENLEGRELPASLGIVQASANAMARAMLAKLPNTPILAVRVQGDPTARGVFTGGGFMGLTGGAVVGGGPVVNLNGPNDITTTMSGVDFPPSGDPTAMPPIPPDPVGDQASIAIDFIPRVSRITIRVVMASDEYVAPGFFGYADDQIGVYVNGINYARIPGTNQIISPASINPNQNANLLIMNQPTGLVGAPFDINADGFTRVFVFTVSVRPNQRNTITLAVSEQGALQDTYLLADAILPGGTGGAAAARVNAYAPYRWTYQNATRTFVGAITITNTGNAAFTAPNRIFVVLPKLPNGARYLNVTTINGMQAIRLNTNRINPGQTIQVNVRLTNPFNLPLPTFYNAPPLRLITT